ncbi:hypothetical protein AWJ20_2824 [Sugiyamaella lignohabitans]|uniref:Uncharacterized protein n=1 Tax=Sugiyamaella lignohabitans TaxID=796027 RepID=A0A161HH41_9ASCO|nr:uncharacterized protein AWJ20_2824 [Sugiyamaella lignohabitans]ANB15200.1 hypothetical protein AWJ20_2824 [Sugiyamaella lignohabitans]
MASASEFEAFDAYDFESDQQFQQGLNTLLTTADTADSVQRDSLVLKAKIFFYSKKTGTSIDFNEYESWKNEHNFENSSSTTNSDPNEPSTNRDNSAAGSTESYPLSYQAIVELIMSGKPVPGIKQIPNTVLGETASSQHTAAERKKPWET